MSDFIREVDEDYRRDRIVNFISKNQIALIGLVLAIVAGTAGYRIYLYRQAQSAETANTRYDAAAQLAREGKGKEAQAAFDKLQGNAPAGYAMLARMRAVEILALRDPAAAARGFDAIAADDGVDPALRDTAQLRAAILRVDLDDPKTFESRYSPFAAQGFTYHDSIRELLALAAFKRNDTEAAGKWLDQIVTDPTAPNALRGRAEAFLGLVAAGPAKIGIPAPPKPVLQPAPATTPLAPPSASATTPKPAPAPTTPPAASATPPAAHTPAAPAPASPSPTPAAH